MNKLVTITALLGVVFLPLVVVFQNHPESPAKLNKEKMKAKEKQLENTIDDMSKWYPKTPNK